MSLRPTPTSIDAYPTPTSTEQAQTEAILSQHRPAPALPKPTLQKTAHLQWLVRNFSQGFPPRFISQDASQPWLMFWTIQAFHLFGASFDPRNRQRCIDTIMACQHPEGGFGGGPHQFPHLLPTYAAVSALAVVGRPGPGGGWDQIDRAKMYAFFLSLKQPDGSFLVARDSEVDVRGIYCLFCAAALLNLLTPALVAGTARFLASLQTYEGGFASASHPYYTATAPNPGALLDAPRPPLGEAHGGYTFCALASWVMLHPFLEAEERPPTIDVNRLARWLALMQGSEAELSGFKGRTNKLVDACYAWWVGGCFPLLRALGVGGFHPVPPPQTHSDDGDDDDSEQWSDVDDELFNRLGLQEYILYAAQHPMGGLRDKPPKPADAYHTLYALSGLSTAQHHVAQSHELRDKFRREWNPQEEDEQGLDEMHKIAYAEARAWREEEGGSTYVGGAGDRLNATHPVFNLTITHVREILVHFYKQA
ncbi:terpenoid cyclases/Protein prenyltransferase [Phellopilus nigrolimitatus]|nr:terpenoid cyclases/Protein prenyltransferase [Phellopilus nigrolimitatus]